jgi:hypothetical protein
MRVYHMGTVLAVAFAMSACVNGDSLPVEPAGALLSKPANPPKDPTATWMIPLNDADLALKSDGQFGDGTYSSYVDGVCNVATRLFATTQGSNSGDAVVRTDGPTKGKSCKRSFTLRYPDGVSETVQSFNNLRALQNTTTFIPVGATERRLLILNPGALATGTRCDRLLFGRGDLNTENGVGSDNVLVTRIDARTWRVQSDPESSKLAWCQKTGELFVMPVDFVVVASYDLPT